MSHLDELARALTAASDQSYRRGFEDGYRQMLALLEEKGLLQTKPWLTEAEAADRLGQKPETIAIWRRQNPLAFETRKVGRQTLYSAASVDAFEARPVERGKRRPNPLLARR